MKVEIRYLVGESMFHENILNGAKLSIIGISYESAILA